MKANFKFERDGYTVQPEKFKRTTTRRGVRTVCEIYHKGKMVALLDDTPERIVAVVTVNGPDRAALLKVAKASGVTVFGDSDETWLSEYLRALTMAAEQAWLEASK